MNISINEPITCPHCGREIGELNYSVLVKEYGCATLRREPADGKRDNYEMHPATEIVANIGAATDSETYEGYEFRCPECDYEISDIVDNVE